MSEPDNAHDAAVERVAKAIYGEFSALMGANCSMTSATKLAEAAIAAYKQALVTDETLWADYKAGRPHAEPAVMDRRSGPIQGDI